MTFTDDTRSMAGRSARDSRTESAETLKNVSRAVRVRENAATRANDAVKDAVGGVKDEYFHGYVAVQSRGTVALPPLLRRRLHLDQPGAQVEITEREDGVLELRPTVAVPAVEAWFWTDRWQEGERLVDAHVAAGETTVHETAEDFLAHLDRLDAE
jgi:bifunctional DNA-binding transcriptional regulator/antitoxin component of YhaV-PrlF toxin-antitoxin module